MKDIVLAGDARSRLSMVTAVTNKHFTPLGNCPTICHPIARLKQAGINDTSSSLAVITRGMP